MSHVQNLISCVHEALYKNVLWTLKFYVAKINSIAQLLYVLSTKIHTSILQSNWSSLIVLTSISEKQPKMKG